MRWERLLADLVTAEEARQRAAMLGEATERARTETARVTLVDRLRAAEGHRLVFEVDGPQRCAGVLAGIGPGWLVLEDDAVQWMLALRHVVWVDELPPFVAPQPQGAARQVYQRLGLTHVLRGIAADRSGVRIGVGRSDPVYGTIDRVGADFVDVAVHPVGEPRRSRQVTGHRTIAIDAVRYVQRTVV